ncbi:MAG: hypothetical protein JAY69_01770 [Candidatus Thiodiazotropha taylori]|nr:hypothetical protein [Candidatus Thiodiazotropha taylori]MCW4231336.1 hypothetical protein [Candidatus Thiodiazotropha taylori]
MTLRLHKASLSGWCCQLTGTTDGVSRRRQASVLFVVTVDLALQVAHDVLKEIHAPFTLDATFERQCEFIELAFRHSIDFFAQYIGKQASEHRVQPFAGVVLSCEPTGRIARQRTQGIRGNNRLSKIELILGTWMSQNLSRDRRHRLDVVEAYDCVMDAAARKNKVANVSDRIQKLVAMSDNAAIKLVRKTVQGRVRKSD